MAAHFLGLSMLVTLNSPPGLQLRGTVSNVVPGESLTLRDVLVLQNGHRIYEQTIQVSNIQDIVQEQPPQHAPVQPQGPPPMPTLPHIHAPVPIPAAQYAAQLPVTAPAAPPAAHPAAAPMFDDPAILSMSRKGTRSHPNSNMNSRQNSNQGSNNNTGGTTPVQQRGGGGTSEVHNHNSQARKRSLAPGIIPVSLIPEATMLPAPIQERRTAAVKKTDDGRKITPAAILVDPMEKLGINDDTEATDAVVLDSPDKRRHKPRRNQRPQRQGRVHNGTDALQTNPAEGWRKTPLLRPNSSFQPFDLLSKSLAQARRNDENGWETNDATDVQEMPEFDFQGALKMFDKRGDFARFREQDMTADEDTCVGMNKLNSPSKNYAPTENVLGSRRESFKDRRESMNRSNGVARAGGIESPAWNSEGSESDDENEKLGSGRHSRARRHDSGAGSAAGMSARSRRGESILRSSIGPGVKRPESSGLAKSVHNSQTRQPRRRTAVPAGAPRSRSQAKAAAGLSGTISPTKGAFYLVPADRRVDVVSALEILNMENVAAEWGFSEELMAEHAARGIAEVALKSLNLGKGHKRVARSPELSVKPHVVVFAGNNKSGIRAIAAGRLLRHHGVDVIVCVVGLDREPELLEGVRRQLKLFRVLGGKGVLPGTVLNKGLLFEYLQRENAAVELIIDGLLGLTMSFAELVHRPGELTDVTELIKYGNRSQALVMAIDVPSGLNPITGEPMVVQNEEEGGWMDPDLVVCLGVPKTGLLEAMRMGMGSSEGEGKGWKLSLVDVGMGRVVWKKAKMKTRRGVEFEGNWVLGMRFQKGSD